MNTRIRLLKEYKKAPEDWKEWGREMVGEGQSKNHYLKYLEDNEEQIIRALELHENRIQPLVMVAGYCLFMIDKYEKMSRRDIE